MNRHNDARLNAPNRDSLRTAYRTAASFLAVGFAMLLGATGAKAATIPMALEEMLAYSDEVVRGVVDAEQEVVMFQGKIFTISTVRVDETLKGSRDVDSTLQIAIPGGEIGFMGMKATNVAWLEPEEEVVLFMNSQQRRLMAEANPQRRSTMDFSHPVLASPLIIGGFQGKFNVVRNEEVREREGRRSIEEVTRVVRHVPGRQLATEDFPTLDDFRQAIGRASSPETPVRTSVRFMPGAPAVDIPVRDPEARAMRVFDSFADRAPMRPMTPAPPVQPERDIRANQGESQDTVTQ